LRVVLKNILRIKQWAKGACVALNSVVGPHFDNLPTNGAHEANPHAKVTKYFQHIYSTMVIIHVQIEI